MRNKVKHNEIGTCGGTPFPRREGGGGLGHPVKRPDGERAIKHADDINQTASGLKIEQKR
ncbi:MAG: hypothetical protein JWL77_5825 [Chthonomonadaceae bacterium]|nr:hypothetical protein [Chthonomonadaceae bacterium]